MRIVQIIIASISTLVAVGLTAFIEGMVELVGKGDNFRFNPLVLLNIVLWITSILLWVVAAKYGLKSGKTKT